HYRRRHGREPDALGAEPPQRPGDVGTQRQPGCAGALPQRAPHQGRSGQARGNPQMNEKKTPEKKSPEKKADKKPGGGSPAPRRFAVDRLMTVVLAPVVSEK